MTERQHDDWSDWLDHYRATTGRNVRGSQAAIKAYGARRADGYTADDLKLATIGAHGDKFLRDNCHDVPDTILRPSKVARYIELGRKSKPSGWTPSQAAPALDDVQRVEGMAAWERARNVIATLAPDAVPVWLDPIDVVGLDGRTLYLAAPEHVANWVQRRFGDVIREATGGLDVVMVAS